ncbi:hypothetical protein [Bradyrhizobium sp. USDA 3364]
MPLRLFPYRRTARGFAGTAIRVGAFASGRLLLDATSGARLNRYGSVSLVVQMQHPQTNMRRNA